MTTRDLQILLYQNVGLPKTWLRCRYKMGPILGSPVTLTFETIRVESVSILL